MGNILHNNKDIFQFRIDKSEYWDFCLSNDNGFYGSSGLTTDCLIAYIDTTNPDCVWFDDLTSIGDYYWEEAVSNGITLNYIGCTGVDNGYIHYQKDRISNRIFYDLFTNSSLSIDEGDYKLRLHKINGNNQIYNYWCNIVEEDGMLVAKMDGGFYQGFFETNCDEYKILPDTIDDGWHFEVTLKKQDFSKGEKNYTLNDKYPDNKGIFLYIGTRAENKWWTLYNVDTEFEKTSYMYVNENYFDKEYMSPVNINENYIKSITDKQIREQNAAEKGFIKNYLVESYWDDCDNDMPHSNNYNFSSDEECSRQDKAYSKNSDFRMPIGVFMSVYQDDAVWLNKKREVLVRNEKIISRHHGNRMDYESYCCNNYFKDNYVNSEYYDTECKDGENCKKYVNDGYVNNEMYIDKNEILYTSEGYAFNNLGIIEYETDNKFMFFDRTCDGYNVGNWNPEEGETVVITDIKAPSDMENYFLLFNRTCHGYNTHNIKKLIDEKNKDYNVLKDLFKNALAFQITDDGKIGYKYFVQDCDAEDWEYKIESEFSAEDTVSSSEWHTINIKITPINKSLIENNKTMQISIYVDGKLRLQSQELPSLKLKKLDDNYDKQQGVPYNISLGGGTQGLCDVVYMDYYKLPEYVLPLEKEFGGTFIGFIKSFKIYNCPMSYNQILNNYIFEKNFL